MGGLARLDRVERPAAPRACGLRRVGARLIAVEQSYDVAAVVATMLCFGAVGFLMNAAFGRLEAILLPWRPDEELAS